MNSKKLVLALITVMTAIFLCACGSNVKQINFSSSTLSLGAGESMAIPYSTVPENPKDGAITWESSDPGIVMVDSSGNIAALAEGEATITAKSGSTTASITVTVESPYQALYNTMSSTEQEFMNNAAWVINQWYGKDYDPYEYIIEGIVKDGNTYKVYVEKDTKPVEFEIEVNGSSTSVHQHKWIYDKVPDTTNYDLSVINQAMQLQYGN